MCKCLLLSGSSLRQASPVRVQRISCISNMNPSILVMIAAKRVSYCMNNRFHLSQYRSYTRTATSQENCRPLLLKSGDERHSFLNERMSVWNHNFIGLAGHLPTPPPNALPILWPKPRGRLDCRREANRSFKRCSVRFGIYLSTNWSLEVRLHMYSYFFYFFLLIDPWLNGA